MTQTEALRRLDTAVTDLLNSGRQDEPARLNRALTREQAIGVIRDAVNQPHYANGNLPEWLDFRVEQVTRNQKRPDGRRLTLPSRRSRRRGYWDVWPKGM